MRRILVWGLVLGVWTVAPFSGAGAAPKGEVLENLQYRVDILGLPELVHAGVVLKSAGPGRYQAELRGEAKGILAPLSGHRQDTYATEMVFRDGRLLPLVYREESQHRGKRRLKEYRFNYQAGTVEMWQPKKGQLVRNWQKKLTGPMYDPLSAFYNCRLGLFGPLAPGETLKVTGIPYPRPEEYHVRLGSQSKEGGQAMVSIPNEVFDKKQGVVFVDFDAARVPTKAWTRILGCGKVVGQLLPTSQTLKGGLPEMGGTGRSGSKRGSKQRPGAASAVISFSPSLAKSPGNDYLMISSQRTGESAAGSP